MATKKKREVVVSDKKPQDYELVYIIRPDTEEEELENRIEGISKFITGNDGTVGEVERWGKKKLSYPIKHSLVGNYVLTRFSMSPAKCKELEANLKISEDILRHLLIKLSG
jgi:small subunit ribosomal protein S6